MVNKLINIVINYLSRLKNFAICKRIYISLIIIIFFIFYDFKLLNRLKNLEPEIIYTTNLCFLPTWRDDLTRMELSCFGNCCLNSTFNLESDNKCILACAPFMVSHYKPNNLFFTFLPVKIFPLSRKKIISFSLYGSSDHYLSNALKVIKAYKNLLPGWITRFYIGSDVAPLLINRLIHTGAEVILVYQNQPSNSYAESKAPGYHGMFWRFFVSEDANVERYIIRDADSLPIQREIDAIDEWIKERKMFHVMRDHLQHATEILGGLWGGLVDSNRFNLSSLYESALADGYDDLDGIWIDQFFLRTYVWPIVRYNMTCHNSYNWIWSYATGCKDFPTKRVGHKFVGEPIDF